MAEAARKKAEVEIRLILHDIEPVIGQILSKVENESKIDIVNELMEHIDQDLVIETRELMYKAACSRYIELLERQDYDPNIGIPYMVLKKRTGDTKEAKNCSDTVDLLIFATGLGDSFPRDVLSGPSKFVELSDIKLTSGKGQKIVTGKIVNSECMDMVTLVNRIRDQDVAIEKISKQLKDVKTMLLKRIDKLQDTIVNLLKDSSLIQGNNIVNTESSNIAQPIHTGPADTEQWCDSIVSLDNESQVSSTNHTAKVDELINIAPTSGDDDIQPPHIDVLTVSPPSGANSGQLSKFTANHDGPEQSVSGSAYHEAQFKPLFTDVLNTDGPWHEVKGRKQSRNKRVVQQNKRNPPKSNFRLELKGSVPDKAMFMYFRNMAMASSDTEHDIIDSIKAYASVNGLKVMHASVVYNYYCDTSVGCKISIPVSQHEIAINDKFWPNNISCRVWQRGKPNQTSNQTDQGQHGASYGNDGRIYRTVKQQGQHFRQ